jgi:tRNA dimethylallyltransferase
MCVIGPTASGKSARAVQLALAHRGEIISVDSRQVYRTLDIGTEKTSMEEMGGIPHHLIDIRDPQEVYTAGDFVTDTGMLIDQIIARENVPILAGGTHFYFDALLRGLPAGTSNPVLRHELTDKTAEDLFALLIVADPARAARIDSQNPRRLIRALELVAEHGVVPERTSEPSRYSAEWIVVDHPKEVLQERINARLEQALARGLIAEVDAVRKIVGDIRLQELGLEYRVIGEYIRGERSEESLLPALSAKLWQLARSQKKWIKKLTG